MLSRTTPCCWQRRVSAACAGVGGVLILSPCSLPSPLTPLQVQKTMKENLAIVEDNFADIEARIKRLQK